MVLFGEIEERLYRFPAIDPPSFRLRVEQELATESFRSTGYYTGASAGLAERRAPTTAPAASALGAWPVTAAMKSSRSEREQVEVGTAP